MWFSNPAGVTAQAWEAYHQSALRPVRGSVAAQAIANIKAWEERVRRTNAGAIVEAQTDDLLYGHGYVSVSDVGAIHHVPAQHVVEPVAYHAAAIQKAKPPAPNAGRFIDDMRLDDWRRGVAAVFDSYVIR